MKFKGSKQQALNEGKIGLLITNLGTPEAPETKALRRYLAEFLSDPRVVEIPRLLWLIILHCVILRVRPKKSAEAYKEVWTERGSPLKYYTEDQAEGLKSALADKNVIVEYGMRYGQPSIESGLDRLTAQDCGKILVLPLYPQYASSTTGSTFDAIAKDFTARRALPQLRFISSYYTFDPYITAIAQSIAQYWEANGKADKLVLSYHGLPKYTFEKGDPYYAQCLETSKLIAAKLGIQESEYQTTFQSRFGKAEWLKPYTDATLKAMPGEGIKSVQVVCPGFSSDCLETIEEIDVENREYFMESGGERYEYIPALNASEEHISALASLVQNNIENW